MIRNVGNFMLLAVFFLSVLYLNQSCKKDENKDEVLETATSLTDSRDGQVYNLVTIGTQKWFAENLNYASSDSWEYNNQSTNGNIYGRLYTWNSACKSCPPGWHLPSDAEWQILVDYLGGEGIAGGKLKEAGFQHWFDPNEGAGNESGFNALPGGYWQPPGGEPGDNGYFGGMGYEANFWSSTPYDEFDSWYRLLSHYKTEIERHGWTNSQGFSVRCVKDN